MTLLVVDPDDATSSALTDSLSQLGFSVSRIPGVRRACARALREQRPELVLVPVSRDRRESARARRGVHSGARPDAAGRDRARTRSGQSAACSQRCVSACVDVIDIDRPGRESRAAGRQGDRPRRAHRARSLRQRPRKMPARARSCANFNATSAPAVTSRWACCRRVRWRSTAIGCGTSCSRR